MTSALLEHACVENSKITTTNPRFHQRRCLEAWHINTAYSPLNRDDGGLLPEAYSYLITDDLIIGLSSSQLSLQRSPPPDENTRLECRNVGS